MRPRSLAARATASISSMPAPAAAASAALMAARPRAAETRPLSTTRMGTPAAYCSAARRADCRVALIFEEMQTGLLEKARAFVATNTTRVKTWDEFKQVMAEKRGFIVAGWNGDAAVEAKIKEETKATIRVIPMGDPIEAECVYTGQKGREVVFAQAY